MECREPGTIRDEELLAYLAGERVRPVVKRHLEICQRCAFQLAEFQRLENTLTRKLYRWDCPPNQILGEYQFGLLSGNIAMAVRTHLSQCALCTADVATLSEFLTNDPMLVENAAGARVSARTSPSNNSRTAEETRRFIVEEIRNPAAAFVRRVVATLVPPQPRFAYQRGSGSAAELWPRNYTAEDLNISIQVEPGVSRRDALQLIGFVKRQGTALEALQGVPVQLITSTNDSYTQNIDDLGNFVFSSVVPASYTLELQLPEKTIMINDLQVVSQD